MKRFVPAILAAVVLAAGCFPVLLDIDAQGRLLVPRSEGLFLYDTKTSKAQFLGRAATGTAAWARWSPDGQFVLLCSTDEGKMSDLSVINVKSRQLKSYGTFSGAAAASWSPDGKTILVAQRKGNNEFALVLVNLTTGERRLALDRALPMHRWISNSAIAAFRIDQLLGEGGRAQGNLVAVNLAGNETKVIAPMTCSILSTMDVDPNGKRLLVTESLEGLFALVTVNLDDGQKKTLVERDVFSGFWSPDGKHMAIVRVSHSGMPRALPSRSARFELAVADGDGANAVVAANDVIARTEYSPEGRPVFPTWTGNNRLLYFESAGNYGPVGGAMHLVSVKIDGTESTDLQASIEAAVVEAPKPSRGK
jgi:Tol biopolymer transport system component